MISVSLPDFCLAQFMRCVGEILEMPAEEVRAKEIQHILTRLGEERDHPRTQLFVQCCRIFLSSVVNANGNFEVNGEAALVESLAGRGLKTILDVGANVGSWSSMFRKFHPDAAIHAFEIVPDTFSILKENLDSDNKVVLNPIGLSDFEGDLTMYTFSENNEVATYLEYPHEGTRSAIEAKCTKGDIYLEEFGINHVDFLKLDVEGAEPKVLAGFSSAFDQDAISLVQFEYGKANILTRFLLHDYYEFFQGRNFAVGKLYPNRVAFKDYTFEDEDFMGYNYIACTKKRPDLIKHLSSFA